MVRNFIGPNPRRRGGNLGPSVSWSWSETDSRNDGPFLGFPNSQTGISDDTRGKLDHGVRDVDNPYPDYQIIRSVGRGEVKDNSQDHQN